MIDVRSYAGHGPDLAVPGVTSADVSYDGPIPLTRIPKLCVPGREMFCAGAPIRFMVPDSDFLKEHGAVFQAADERWCIRERGTVFDVFYYIPAMWGLRIG